MNSKTVLLVDDEKKVLFLLTEALEEKGFTIKSTTFPSQALEIFQNEAIDAVVVDLVMPVTDGIKILQAMKKKKTSYPRYHAFRSWFH